MVFSAVFIISAIIFALEILEMRILSFSAWHYLTYIVVTVAVLGSAVAGIFMSMKKNVANYEKISFKSSVLFTISIPFSFFALSRIPLDSMMSNKFYLIVFVSVNSVILFIPSFLASLSLVSLFEKAGKNVNIIYFFSVAGSVAGCLSALPLMEFFGMAGALSLIVCGAAFSSLLLSVPLKESRKNIAVSVILLFFSLSLLPIQNQLFSFRTAVSKVLGSVTNEQIRPEYTKWDRAGRIDIAGNTGNLTVLDFFPGAKRGVVTIDGDAASFIYDFSDDPEQIALSLYSAGYLGLQNPDVFVAGLSTTDIAAALFWQAESVTSVDVNKAMIELIMQKYSTFKNNILKNGKVSIVHDEVRAFLEKNPKKYDLIQLSGTDTASVLLNGIYIMSETYLYTEEAFKSYIEHLNDNGTLAVTRWMFWPARETLRIASTAVAALKEAGIENPENNIVIVGNGVLASTLVKKRPFTWTELNDLLEVTKMTTDLRIVYAPGFSAGESYYDPIFKTANFSTTLGTDFINNGFRTFFDSVSQGKEKSFIRNYVYNVNPASDDKPFFFNYSKFSDKSFLREIRTIVTDPSTFQLIILLSTFILLLFMSLSMLTTPLFFMPKDEKRYLPELQILSFALVGFGFMFIEITLIQAFTLIFGDPASSAAAAIAVLLVFSALGSLFSKKILILLGEKMMFGAFMVALPLIILGYAAVLPYFMNFCIAYGYGLKMLFTVLFIAPLGFLIGLVFPTSLIIVGEKKNSFVPLAFGANGAASVLATVVSVMLAMLYGFKFVFVTSAFCYFFALSAMLYFVRKQV